MSPSTTTPTQPPPSQTTPATPNPGRRTPRSPRSPFPKRTVRQPRPIHAAGEPAERSASTPRPESPINDTADIATGFTALDHGYDATNSEGSDTWTLNYSDHRPAYASTPEAYSGDTIVLTYSTNHWTPLLYLLQVSSSCNNSTRHYRDAEFRLVLGSTVSVVASRDLLETESVPALVLRAFDSGLRLATQPPTLQLSNRHLFRSRPQPPASPTLPVMTKTWTAGTAITSITVPTA